MLLIITQCKIEMNTKYSTKTLISLRQKFATDCVVKSAQSVLCLKPLHSEFSSLRLFCV